MIQIILLDSQADGPFRAINLNPKNPALCVVANRDETLNEMAEVEPKLLGTIKNVRMLLKDVAKDVERMNHFDDAPESAMKALEIFEAIEGGEDSESVNVRMLKAIGNSNLKAAENRVARFKAHLEEMEEKHEDLVQEREMIFTTWATFLCDLDIADGMIATQGDLIVGQKLSERQKAFVDGIFTHGEPSRMLLVDGRSLLSPDQDEQLTGWCEGNNLSTVTMPPKE